MLYRILDRLYLGDFDDSQQFDRLKAEHIFYILNCAEELNYKVPDEFCLERLRIDDDSPDFDEIQEGIRFIANNITYGKILVHCGSGISRSPAIVIAYLVYIGYSRDSALKLVESIKPSVKPNPAIMDMILMAENSMLGMEE